MPSMVRLLSAMLVASTILRAPAGGAAMAASCAAASSPAYSGHTRTSAGSSARSSPAARRRISGVPGRNTSRLPLSCASARRMAATSRPSSGPSPGRWRTLTGKLRPALLTRGAPPSSSATAAPSSVALITSSRRSGRSSACACTHSARPRSACRLRSWYSSKITSPTPVSAGSACNKRVRMPSVMTSMRVAADTRLSRRVR